MRPGFVPTAFIVALLVVIPRLADAGGAFPTDRGHAFRAPSVPVHARPSFSAPRRFAGRPFVPFVAGPRDAYEVPDDDVIVLQPVPSAPPVERPVAEPKFLSPPAPAAPGSAGARAVVIQRGSKIEIQSFP